MSDESMMQLSPSMRDEFVTQLGIDVGGTSIKGAVVDLSAGELAGQHPHRAHASDCDARSTWWLRSVASRPRRTGPAPLAWPFRA